MKVARLSAHFGLHCYIYDNDGVPGGVPSKSKIRGAIREAGMKQAHAWHYFFNHPLTQPLWYLTLALMPGTGTPLEGARDYLNKILLSSIGGED